MKRSWVRGNWPGVQQFHFGGRYKKLLDSITVADVAWICERLNRVTDRQWRDAFRAGGFEASLTTSPRPGL
jgi:hypothetical protein